MERSTLKLIGTITGMVLAFFAFPAFAGAATLGLSPSSKSTTNGTNFDVQILLNTTGTMTSGTDAYIRFDPAVFQVVDKNSSAEGTQITPGSLYSVTSFNSSSDNFITSFI